jgi:hypothetical protein
MSNVSTQQDWFEFEFILGIALGFKEGTTKAS